MYVTTIEFLFAHGITAADWAQEHFGTDTWHGDICGCPDDRCLGNHHDEADPCPCVRSLVTNR